MNGTSNSENLKLRKAVMDLQEITEKYLKENGFDGLYNDGECACKTGHLMPCGNPSPRCRAGYLAPCPENCGEHGWHIAEEKPQKSEKKEAGE